MPHLRQPSLYLLFLAGLHQVLIVLGYTLRNPRHRSWAFDLIAFVTYRIIFRSRSVCMTGVTALDLPLGICILVQTVAAFNGLVLIDAQKILYRVGEQPGQIVSASLKNRLFWAIDLLCNPRGIGWMHEISGVRQAMDNEGRYHTTFISLRLKKLGVDGIVLIIVLTFYVIDPTISYGAQNGQPLIRRGLICLLGYGALYTALDAAHCSASIVAVTLGISTPNHWPHFFGPVTNAYTLQNFWGLSVKYYRVFWHQSLRKPLVDLTKFIVRCHSSSSSSHRLLKLYTVFILSGLIHMGAQFIVSGKWSTSFLFFFVLQPLGIAIEVVVHHFTMGLLHGGEKLQWLWRLVGYVWVLIWMTAAAPLAHEIVTEKGLFYGIPGLEID
ncbi:hypothetical protein NP233_g448 [Leucocoprinus birnbaumii]|uniref:Wax synthase domain-containing protein n=1 Tax=Leucocoprinus birnbaumii TaxID=56174 RepID=A0AAD5YYN2_9AGAR|nr:hypothetical protein NP233_g448 [Leucocoprinus birnbaumii]